MAKAIQQMNNVEQLVLSAKQSLASLADDDKVGNLSAKQLASLLAKIDAALSPAKMQARPPKKEAPRKGVLMDPQSRPTSPSNQ